MGRIKSYLIDTDLFIDWLNGMPWARLLFSNPPGKLFYSKITRKELLSVSGISDSEKRSIKNLLDHIRFIGVTAEIASIAAGLIDTYEISVSDALIAATALNKQLILVTRNQKHYRMIPDLELYDVEA